MPVHQVITNGMAPVLTTLLDIRCLRELVGRVSLVKQVPTTNNTARSGRLACFRVRQNDKLVDMDPQLGFGARRQSAASAD